MDVGEEGLCVEGQGRECTARWRNTCFSKPGGWAGEGRSGTEGPGEQVEGGGLRSSERRPAVSRHLSHLLCKPKFLLLLSLDLPWKSLWVSTAGSVRGEEEEGVSREKQNGRGPVSWLEGSGGFLTGSCALLHQNLVCVAGARSPGEEKTTATAAKCKSNSKLN